MAYKPTPEEVREALESEEATYAPIQEQMIKIGEEAEAKKKEKK